MSKFIGDVIRVTGFTTTNAYIGGTARFLSPELLQDAPKTTMTDIWAFGCLISQIVTDLQPYSHIKSDYAVFPEILRCGPPITAEDREAHSPGRTDFWVTVTKCWSQEADARPTAADLLREIAGLLSSPEADGSPTSTEENYFVLPPQQYRGDSPKAILTHSPRLEADNRPRPDPDVDAAEVGILDKRSLPINFPRRLFAILQDPDVADNIHWKEDGRTFVIRRTSEFAQHVLPMYYGHFSFRTFVKLLTMHDFRVIAKPYSIQDGEMFECSHPMFVRDHPSLLQAVRKSINKDTPAERTHESPRTRSGPPYWNYTAQR
ncbi:hypothetical protein FRC02_011220 [Tulasnella sp. 418]|nr:hypothetical protein FRC02_011220 [Tulasnella sp. 418]